jgi:hypothetical protein
MDIMKDERVCEGKEKWCENMNVWGLSGIMLEPGVCIVRSDVPEDAESVRAGEKGRRAHLDEERGEV